MGRTLATATQILSDEQQAFANFRRALRLQDQQAFDELFAFARKHTPAVSMAAHALPFETILLAMLLEEHREKQRLQERVELLAQRVERLLAMLSSTSSPDE
jgi:hypothetical protein